MTSALAVYKKHFWAFNGIALVAALPMAIVVLYVLGIVGGPVPDGLTFFSHPCGPVLSPVPPILDVMFRSPQRHPGLFYGAWGLVCACAFAQLVACAAVATGVAAAGRGEKVGFRACYAVVARYWLPIVGLALINIVPYVALAWTLDLTLGTMSIPSVGFYFVSVSALIAVVGAPLFAFTSARLAGATVAGSAHALRPAWFLRAIGVALCWLVAQFAVVIVIAFAHRDPSDPSAWVGGIVLLVAQMLINTPVMIWLALD